MEDASLMKQIAGGDEAALQALLRRYGPLIRYILRPILPDQRDREECYADISLKIWQTAGSFDETKGTLKAWLTVLSRNSALNHARRRTEADAPLEEHMPHEAGSAEEALLRRERQAKLKAVIAALPAGGAESVLPKVLLLPAHGADGCRAVPDGAGGRGAAVPPAAAAAGHVGR